MQKRVQQLVGEKKQLNVFFFQKQQDLINVHHRTRVKSQ